VFQIFFEVFAGIVERLTTFLQTADAEFWRWQKGKDNAETQSALRSGQNRKVI